jgi:ribulose 1,5-bisphosphate carboxylase large subunit-like protein
VRAVFDVRPTEWAETLAVLQSVSLAGVRSDVRARVVDIDGTRVTLDFPALDRESSAEQLLAVCVSGEWADRDDLESCRLLSVDWPEELPGPAFGAQPGVTVGAIAKPALGLSAQEAGEVAARLVAAGATLVKDDELQRSSPERARAIAAAGADYAANVTGPDYLALAEAVLEAGATTLMVNAFLQGLGSIAELRRFGAPIFVHRVGSAFLRRSDRVSVAARVLAELTRLLGADYVQVGSFSPRMFDTDDEVRQQIAACHDELHGAKRATAVIGGGVGPANAEEMLDVAGVRDGVMVLYGSALY